jgi:HAD superfamily hydrolase (TIGR01459 family)
MQCNGLAEIADRFDAMLIDQFGVLHNGKALYPGVLDALERLRDRHIPVVILTNSGKRSASNEKRLVDLGVPRDCFVGLVSSGEICFKMLDDRPLFLIGREGEAYGFDGIECVDDPHRAERLVFLGSNAPKTSLDEYRRLLEGLSLPAICCNPDRLMITSDGIVPAPGAIAALYEEMGGTVTWIGKPYPEIYHHAVAMIGQPQKVLCIGDSLEHDIAGGKAAGYSTLLTLTGISADRDPSNLSPMPDFWLEAFRW